LRLPATPPQSRHRFAPKMRAEHLLAAGLLVASATAFGSAPKPKPEVTKVEDFKWTDPFANRKYKRFAPACDAKQTFQAFEYELYDLSEEPPLGMGPFDDALKKVFNTREYPGSWGGWDKHQYDRNLLMMEYHDMPVKVREWIEDQERNDGEGKGLFAVFNKPAQGNKAHKTVSPPLAEKAAGLRPLDKKKLVFFAPGALYNILPLWVASGSGCEGTLCSLGSFYGWHWLTPGLPAQLSDLDNYDSKLVDGGVVAWPVKYTNADRKNDKREVEFTIQAQVLKAAESSKEEL
jgi:hypothetical protein